MQALCLICLKPNLIWLEFLAKLKSYTVYVVCDDNSTEYQIKYKNYSNVIFIQIQNVICQDAGFTNMNYLMKKPVTGWEKAIYYFSTVNISFTRVWFIEDDVYFYDELVLTEIDKKYPESALLTNRCFIKGEEPWVHWQKTTINLEEPHYKAMVCACRLSKTLLELINIYAQQHKTLFFLEALFPTLAKQNNLLYDTPPEFEPVQYNAPIKKTDKTHLYHPVKNMIQQQRFRCEDTVNP